MCRVRVPSKLPPAAARVGGCVRSHPHSSQGAVGTARRLGAVAGSVPWAGSAVRDARGGCTICVRGAAAILRRRAAAPCHRACATATVLTSCAGASHRALNHRWADCHRSRGCVWAADACRGGRAESKAHRARNARHLPLTHRGPARRSCGWPKRYSPASPTSPAFAHTHPLQQTRQSALPFCIIGTLPCPPRTPSSCVYVFIRAVASQLA